MPVVFVNQVIFQKVNMAHAVFRHIHANPDGIDLLNIIIV